MSPKVSQVQEVQSRAARRGDERHAEVDAKVAALDKAAKRGEQRHAEVDSELAALYARLDVLESALADHVADRKGHK